MALSLEIPVWERIMDGFTILESYHSQIFFKLWNKYPKPNSAIRLKFSLNRIAQSHLAPFQLQIRSF